MLAPECRFGVGFLGLFFLSRLLVLRQSALSANNKIQPIDWACALDCDSNMKG